MKYFYFHFYTIRGKIILFGNYVWFWLGEGSLLPWKGKLEQTPLNRCQPLPAPYKRLIHDINITNKQSEQNDLTLLTDRDWPITTDLRHLGLTANSIMAKLTNQFIQTGLRTFDWQQLFTWLWRWLPLRLSKRQLYLFKNGQSCWTFYKSGYVLSVPKCWSAES